MISAPPNCRRGRMPRVFVAVGGLILLWMSSPAVHAQQAADFFQQNCMSCHTIGGGRLTGPDLKDVTQHKDRTWLVRWLQNPKAVVDSGDPYATQMVQESRGVIMPMVSGMTPDLASGLLDLIEAESKLAKSRFAGLAISDRPFTRADVLAGRALFLGRHPLTNGGPACASCHTLGTLGVFGGGRLGPDLTRVYERLGGRKAVGAWLLAPATPTMQSVFRRHALQPDEVLPLLAVIENANAAGREADAGQQLDFFLAGFGGMVLGLGLLGRLWKSRLKGVRRPLVQGGERGAL